MGNRSTHGSDPVCGRESPAHGFGAGALGAGLQFAETARIAIIDGYRVAPALMLGLGLAMGLPLLTFLSRVVRAICSPADATRRYKPKRDDDFEAEIACEPAVNRGNPFVEIDAGKAVMRCPIPRDMLRIGREDDNDIRIPSGAVHRYPPQFIAKTMTTGTSPICRASKVMGSSSTASAAAKRASSTAISFNWVQANCAFTLGSHSPSFERFHEFSVHALHPEFNSSAYAVHDKS